MCRLARWDLPQGPLAPRTARRAVAQLLRDWGAAPLIDPALLAVSELVTNAVVHATPPLVLLVALDEASVELAVRDGHPQLPSLGGSGGDDSWLAHGGRGLDIVRALAGAYGVTPDSEGKWVWCVLDPPDTGGRLACGHPGSEMAQERLPSGRIIKPLADAHPS